MLVWKPVSWNRKHPHLSIFLFDGMLSAGKLDVVSSVIIVSVSDVFVLEVAVHTSVLNNINGKNAAK